VLFAVPYDQPPSDSPGAAAASGISWKLQVTAVVPGADLTTHFEVPVFLTPQSSPDFRLDEREIARYEDKSRS
jgi:hypothetical protein